MFIELADYPTCSNENSGQITDTSLFDNTENDNYPKIADLKNIRKVANGQRSKFLLRAWRYVIDVLT
jgi:hypothetical protein